MEKFLRQALLLLLVGVVSASAVHAQQVKGTVTDRDGNNLPGVTVVIVGTTTGVSTNNSGDYTITLTDASKQSLQFSYIGHESQEVRVGSKNLINIEMVESSTMLNTVVAIGYGTTKRSDVVGSISSISAETLINAPVASIVEAMSGRMAGVHVSSTEGNPDAEIKIRVRGGTSISQNNDPLYVVDGFTVSSINDIAASEIESIDVLKDAFSTAIYGSRGANGVVIVTTKSGTKGKLIVNYNMYAGFKNISKTMDALSSDEFVKYQYELTSIRDEVTDKYEPYFGTFQDIDLYKNLPKTDWLDQVFGKTASTFSHNLSVRGGGDKFSWTANYAHINDGSIMVGSNFKRDNLSFKANFKPVKRVALDFSVRYSDADYNGSGANGDNDKGSNSGGRLKHTMIYTPFPLMKAIEGSDQEEEYGDTVNPLTAIKDNDNRRNRKEWNANAAFTWEIIDNLKFKTDIGIQDFNQEDDRFYGLSTYYVKNSVAKDYQNMPATINTQRVRDKLSNTNTLNFDFKNVIQNKDHNLSILVGEEYIITKSNTKTAEVNALPLEFTSETAWKAMGLGVATKTDNFFNADDVLFSFFSRASYDYKGKYSLSATFRADGSSKFADNYRWGYFPSAAVAWRISEEPWMESSKSWLSNLKVRYSFGTTGNNNIPSEMIIRSFTAGTTNNTSTGGTTLKPSKILSNPKLKWETTYSQNVGVDYGFWKNRINGSIEIYNNTTKDLLMRFPLPGSGYDAQYKNIGETRNRGVEFSVDAILIDKPKYGLNFSFNVGFNKNKIMKLGIDDFYESSAWSSTEIGGDFIVREGGSVGEMFGYVTDGRYEVSDFSHYDDVAKRWVLNAGVADASSVIGAKYLRPGALKLQNLDPENGELVDANDRKIIGNANPKHTGGFTISGHAYGFDLTANFNWVYGNDIYNANKIEFTSSRKYNNRNMSTDMALGNRWTNIDWQTGEYVNDGATLAQMNETTSLWSPVMNQSVFHSWAVEDGSFLRLSNLTIGYTLPAKITKKFRIERLRVYATGSNLFCWTNYSGFDPEVDTRRQTPLTPGVDYSGFPKSRQFVFGLNLTF